MATNYTLQGAERFCPGCGAPAKGGKWGRWVLIGLGVLFVGLAALGQRTASQQPQPSPRTSTAAPASTPKPEPPAAPAEVPIEVNAPQLVQAYADNEVAADEQYKGKLVRTAGRVTRIGKDITDEPYVTFAGSVPFREVQVFFQPAERPFLAKLKAGDILLMDARVDGLMMNVILRNARITGIPNRLSKKQ